MEKRFVRVKVYACSKCGMTISTNSTPSACGCPCGGSHRWVVTYYNA